MSGPSGATLGRAATNRAVAVSVRSTGLRFQETNAVLPRQNRLRNDRDFRRVYREGHRVDGRHLVLYIRAREEGPPRFGVVAGKRLGGAVQRNRAKRVVRACCRKMLPAVVPRFDIVITARRPFPGQVGREVCDELWSLLERAGVLNRSANGTRSERAAGDVECERCASN